MNNISDAVLLASLKTGWTYTEITTMPLRRLLQQVQRLSKAINKG